MLHPRPSRVGGVSSHVEVLLPHLAPFGIRGVPVPGGVAAGLMKVPSAAIVHLNPSLRWRALLRDLTIAYRARSQGSRILLHLHGWSPRLASSLARARLHGLDWHHVRLMALGETFRSRLVDMGIPAARIGVMGPCARSFDLPPWNPDGPWLFLGRLEPGKGAEELIRAAERPVVIAGEGSERSYLEALAAQLGVQARFTGWAANIEPLLADAGALVLPSREEGLPVAILEALGSRRPVVATNVGAISEVLANPVPVGDIDALRQALHAVREVSEAQAWSIRARYRPEAVAAQCLEAYRMLLAEP
jgi:glycosyltransferase involved in cell wall biosynthesis